MTDATEWTGVVGDVWAAEWQRTDRSFAALAPQLDAAILAALPPGSASAADIGCGAGATSIALATARPDVQVTGVDISSALIAAARDRGAHCPNLRFAAATIEEALPALAPVDLFFSRHGVMFFADPSAAFERLRAAAAPDGRIVFSCFRALALNPWATELAAIATDAPPPPPAGYSPGPFAFADPVFVEALLTSAGWRHVQREAVDYSFVAGEGKDPVGDALSFFLRIGPTARILRLAEESDRPAMIARIAAMLERHRSVDTVRFAAAAWLWSARAR